MEFKSKISSSISPDGTPKDRLTFPILLGFLTFLVGGPLALLIIIIFPVSGIKLAAMLLTGAWGGYAVLQFSLFILFALLNDFVTALISWFIYRSKKLAGVTFISALTFQIIAAAIVVPIILKKSQETMDSGRARENAYTRYATINDVEIDPQLPFNFSHAVNGQMTETILYKKLVFKIPITVVQGGIYDFNVRYTSDRGINSFDANSDSPTNTKYILNAGNQVIKIEFAAGAAPNLGYNLPSSVHGRAIVELYYAISKKELFDSMKADSKVDQRMLKQFMKDEGLDERIDPAITINKFVDGKRFGFESTTAVIGNWESH